MRYVMTIIAALAAAPAHAITPAECAAETREALKSQSRFMEHLMRLQLDGGEDKDHADERAALSHAGDSLIRRFEAYQEYLEDFCVAVERGYDP